MPRGAVFGAAADVGDRVRTAAGEPGPAGERAVVRGLLVPEAAVPVEQRGPRPLLAGRADDEVRDLRAVGGGREELPDRQAAGVEAGGGLLERLGVGADVPVREGGGLQEAVDVEEVLVADVRVGVGDGRRGQRRYVGQRPSAPAVRAGVRTSMRVATSASVSRIRWWRVQLCPASAVRSSGANSTCAVRSPARKASKSKARSEPAGCPSHEDFGVTISHCRYAYFPASSGTSILTSRSPSARRWSSSWKKSVERETKARSWPGSRRASRRRTRPPPRPRRRARRPPGRCPAPAPDRTGIAGGGQRARSAVGAEEDGVLVDPTDPGLRLRDLEAAVDEGAVLEVELADHDGVGAVPGQLDQRPPVVGVAHPGASPHPLLAPPVRRGRRCRGAPPRRGRPCGTAPASYAATRPSGGPRPARSCRGAPRGGRCTGCGRRRRGPRAARRAAPRSAGLW